MSHDHEALILRPKPGTDSATPSGNGVAALALQRLGHVIGEPRYIAAAERALKLFYPMLERQPSAFSGLATALDEYLAPPRTIVLRGPDEGIERWRQTLAARYRPDTLTLAIPAAVADLPDALAKPVGPTVNAWICHGATCLPPVADPSMVERMLAEG